MCDWAHVLAGRKRHTPP